ncbi:hypothetical protein KUTeg_023199 [Tegillarca granosa]|uniref:procollagen-proline 3-dioxygenase n=1 Tax=Tegillarca granosa TaxID=220873 RepID=A0ABQ9E1C0_TEGGR|nr:hypothetical protein KUTeg_023199 [Tegillarca granosa]
MTKNGDAEKVTCRNRCQLKMEEIYFTILCVLYFITTVVKSESTTEPLLHYDSLYESGLEAYQEEKWSQCVAFIEQALSDYHKYKHSLTDCRIQCKNKIQPYSVEDVTHVDIYKLELIQRTVVESLCVERCKHRHSGDRFLAGADPFIEEGFSNRKPYEYLQFCYYKVGRISEAASAAYTYFLANPKHEETIDNLHYYRIKEGVNDADITDLERKPYQSFNIKGQTAHDNQQWSDVIEYFEQAIKEYYNEEDRCRATCEDLYDAENLPEDFKYTSITDLYVKVISCQYECEDKLNHLYVDEISDFVPEHYNYLQYAYHKVEMYDKAVEAVATYLLFIPDNEDLISNKIYYLKKLGYHEGHFVPRQDAVEYHKNRELMRKILKIADQHYSSSFDTESEPDSEEQDNDQSFVLPPFGSQHNLKFSKKGKYIEWYESMGVKVVAEKKDLKGSRVVADGFCREEQCEELVLFANLMKPNKRGVRVMNISDALKIVKENDESDISLRLFLRAVEVNRHFVSHYFNKTAMFVKDAKLVCREPQITGNVISSVNKAIAVNVAYPLSKELLLELLPSLLLSSEYIYCYIRSRDTRLYRTGGCAVAYLQNLEDGDAYFTDRYGNKQSNVSLKCGRIAGFKASDRHSIEESKSQRCSLYVRLTMDRVKDDPTQRRAMEYLVNVDQSQHNASNTMNRSEYIKHFEEQGISVAMSGEELKGKERFVADGLANKEQCNTLIKLAKRGVDGDGYDRGIEKRETIASPHTKHETFEGLTVSRAIKLAHIEAIEQSSVELFIELSENARLYVENSFILMPSEKVINLNLINKDREGDLSHPVHADNCNIQDDGSCTRVHPAYTQREYSAILYLNDEFNGGEFFFAHPNKSEQVKLKPKCGRLVGFNAGEFHGVKPVLRGQRCAVAMWYTFDPNHKELAHIQAKKMLKKLAKKLQKSPQGPPTDVREEL